MRRRLALVLLALGFAWLLIGQRLATASADGSQVVLLHIDGTIDGVSARYLARGIDQATAAGAVLAIVQLDTPGGLLNSTRDMVEKILGASVPVAVFVSPSGAHAASAGTFITAAANFAVMAPGTNIGAASPVASGGQDLPQTLEKKINEDTRAFIRSIAEARNRDSPALEETVINARSYTAEEAVEKRVVDFIARDLADLLAQLDGKTAQTAAGIVTLRTQGVSLVEMEMTLLERFLNVLANPNLAVVLFAIGGLGVLTELFTPGFVGPGVVGVISLALAFVGMGNLPVNWVGLGLILFSLLLLFLELQESGIGIFGIGGIISFILGAFFLFGSFVTPDITTPSFRVSLWLIAVLACTMGGFLILFLYLARTVTWSPVIASRSGKALIGQSAVALSDLTPSGKVRVGNESWTATTTLGNLIREGEEVKVVGVYGRVLKVSRKGINK